ncbi:MAG: cyclic nucleotide-binding domain-containing protein, partial [Myxococcota bacterium]
GETVELKVNALDGLEHLEGLRPWERTQLMELAPPHRYADGALLCREGMVGDTCFVLVTGELEVLKAKRQGEELLATLRRGALVGQMALVDGAARSASVRARGEVVALTLTRAHFETLLEQESGLGLHIQELTAVAGIRQLRMANQWQVSAAAAAHNAPMADADAIAGLESALGEWGVAIEELECLPVHVAVEPHPAEV